jgi:hypothetical protein
MVVKTGYLNRIISGIIVFISVKNCLIAQTAIEPSKLKQFNITVNFDDYTVKTQMLSQNKKISVNNDRVYLWYASQKIMETKGGYDGKLIHGTYRAFYLNNQLKEQGEINYGLKNKEWKYWYPDGKLKEVINWKNGVKNGAYYLYNDYGELMAKSNFKEDKLDGKFYTYGPNGKLVDKKKYKKGEEIFPKVKSKQPEGKKQESREQKEPKEKSDPKKDSLEKKSPLLKGLFKKKDKSSGPASQPKTDKKRSVTS